MPFIVKVLDVGTKEPVSAMLTVPEASILKDLVPTAEGSPDILTPLWRCVPCATVNILSGVIPMPTIPLFLITILSVATAPLPVPKDMSAPCNPSIAIAPEVA